MSSACDSFYRKRRFDVLWTCSWAMSTLLWWQGYFLLWGAHKSSRRGIIHSSPIKSSYLDFILDLRDHIKILLTLMFFSSYLYYRYSFYYRPHICTSLTNNSHPFFNVTKFLGLTYLTKLLVGLSHLCEHKFIIFIIH